MNFQPSLIMLNRYFSERRPLANGLAAAGSPVALCCLSPLGQILQDKYGWRGGFLILGGILLNCCACGALMRPLLPPKKLEDGTAQAVEEEKPKKKLLDFSVFKDRGFLIYTVAASIMVLGLFVPPVFVVSYAKGLGYEDTKSALLLTILGFVDMFARPASGLIAGLKWVRPRTVYLFSFAMLFNGITDLVGSQVPGSTRRDMRTFCPLVEMTISGLLSCPPCSGTLCSSPCRQRTIPVWWSSASSSVCPMAWWARCSSRSS